MNIPPTRVAEPIANNVKRLADAYSQRLREIRRYLHRRPERSGNEYATTEFLAEIVTDLGLEPIIAGDKRGLFVDVGDDSNGPRIAIRGDIDALPIQTELETAYASRSADNMHACGHDAHATMAWGALAILNDLHSESPPHVNLPAVRVIFQPEEETSRGGLHMIEAGALNHVAAAIALHVDPTRPVGTIGVREGALTAGCDLFECEIDGRGGHGARPHLTSDTIGAAAQWVTDIYRRVPRTTDARDAVVVNVGQVNSGAAPNVVPSSAKLTGTLRTLTADSAEQAKVMMQDISNSIASVHRCTVSLKFGQHTPPVINDRTINEHLASAGIELLGESAVRRIKQPSMGAEDFAFIANEVPAAMFRLGVAGIDVGSEPLHTPKFDIDEAALPIGASVLAMAAIHWHSHSPTKAS